MTLVTHQIRDSRRRRLPFAAGTAIAALLAVACPWEPPPPSTWEEAASPRVVYVNRDSEGDGALFDSIVPDPVRFIRDLSLEVVRLVAPRAQDIEPVRTITLVVEDFDGVASKSGWPPDITIRLSSRHLGNAWRARNLDFQALLENVESIFVHELAHCYSPNDVPYSQIAGLVEGLAAAVVIQSGRRDASMAKPGGAWNAGYGTTAFFLVWIDERRFPDLEFVRRLTTEMREADGSSWPAAAIERLTGVGVASLWDEYQAAWPWPLPDQPLVAALVPPEGCSLTPGLRPSFYLHVQAPNTSIQYDVNVAATDLVGGNASYSIGLGPLGAVERNVRVEGPCPLQDGNPAAGNASSWVIRLIERGSEPENVVYVLELSIPVTWE